MPVTFYPSVAILRGEGEMGVEIEYPLGYANSGDTLFCDTVYQLVCIIMCIRARTALCTGILFIMRQVTNVLH